MPTSIRGEANPLGLTLEERAWLKENPIVRVHNELDLPPFNFNEYGGAQGLSIDYMKLWASKVGLGAEFVSGPTRGGVLEMVKAGKLDVITKPYDPVTLGDRLLQIWDR